MDKQKNEQILFAYLNELQIGGKLNKSSYQKGKELYELGKCYLLSSTPSEYNFEVADDYQDFKVKVGFAEKQIESYCNCGLPHICAHIFACLQQTQQEMNRSFLVGAEEGLQYSREGMIKRVLEERRKRASQEVYQIEFADNIHGEHLLHTSHNKQYELSFYDFDKNLGYCSCPDYQTNKLETCKHLIFAFEKFEERMGNNELPNQPYPFLEIFRHPLNDYQISWFYPQKIDGQLKSFLNGYFDEKHIWRADKWSEMHRFMEEYKKYKLIKVRPEVHELVEDYYEAESLAEIYNQSGIHHDIISPKLFPFQVEGALFIARKKGSFLADEIGLGKSAQALSAAVLKIKYSHMNRVHIICPGELKTQWAAEINQWVPDQLRKQFVIFGMNQIAKSGICDFLIIDEAQKIDDYESGLLGELSRLDYKHIVLITDSKYESSLMKFHAVSTLIDKHMLTPLWELSYKHCLFDPNIPEKTIAYHHLELVGKRLENFYLRRERADVLNQLPPAKLMEVSVPLNHSLKVEQSALAKKIAKLCKKNHLNNYDWMQLRINLEEILKIGLFNITQSYIALQLPKISEFIHFALHKLNAASDQKVVVFAEGKDLKNRIVRALREERINAGLKLNDEIQFLVTHEDGEKDFDFAHHFVYLHIPKNPALIEKRMQKQRKQLSGFDQSLFYLLRSVDSFESLIFDWQKSKPYFVEQMLAFVYENPYQKNLSLRLREELAHELNTLTLTEPLSSSKEKQPKLFANKLYKSKELFAVREAGHLQAQTDLERFLQSLLETCKHFENLDASQKQMLETGSIEVEQKNEEMLIRIRKK
jgi:hypothetical protein